MLTSPSELNLSYRQTTQNFHSMFLIENDTPHIQNALASYDQQKENYIGISKGPKNKTHFRFSSYRTITKIQIA